MAAPRGENQTVKQTKKVKFTNDEKKNVSSNIENQDITEEHLPPLPLVLTILICSGALSVLALRDVLATGRNIGGSWDEAMLLFTKSTHWFDDSMGWKSTQGGLSAIQHVTTDENNMGGFFIRKVGGAAALAVHLQKLFPMLVHPIGAQWTHGHFHPLLWTALVGNVAVMSFYGAYWHDLVDGGVQEMTMLNLSVLGLESFVIIFCLLTCPNPKKTLPAVALREGKSPSSLPSNIVARTVVIVSSLIAMVAARDLLFPGSIIELIPRDDIYLEWTNAFLHSPPEGSTEAIENGLEAPLYIGDKFVAQFMALHILILCLYKFVSATWIRLGSDASGQTKSMMIWKGQAIGNGLLLLLFRLFAPAAQSASLDLRWHLMCLAYETFILGFYGYFY